MAVDLARLGLAVDGDGFIRVVDRAGESVERLEKKGGAAEAMVGRLKKAFVGLVGAVTIAGFLHTVTTNTIESQKAMAQLEAGIASTRGAAGLTAGQLDDLSVRIQRLTGVGDEATKGVEALLLTFTNVRGDVFKDATMAVVDMSERMGGDMRGAAVQVGKALQDPIKGITALQRVGVAFTSSQKEQIRTMVASGRVMDAQRMILKELEKEFGGSAAAARNTFGGALRAVKEAFGDLFEVSPTGSTGIIKFLNDVEKGLVYLKANVIPVVGDALTWLWGIVRSGIQVWRDLPQGVKTTVVVLGAFLLMLPRVAALVSLLASAVVKAAAAFREMAAAEGLAQMLSPQGWLTLGLAAVATGFAYAGYKALQAAADARRAAEEFRAALALMDDAALLAQSRAENLASARAHQELQRTQQQIDAARKAGTVTRDPMVARWYPGGPAIIPGRDREKGLTPETQRLIDYAEALKNERDRHVQNAVAISTEIAERARLKAMQGKAPPFDIDVGGDKAATDRLAQNEAIVRVAQQAVELARLEGMAQERLAIDYDRVNKEKEAGAKLTGWLLNVTVAAIREEARLRMQALDVRALREQTQAREEMLRTSQQAIDLAQAEGAAQTKLRIEYDAANKAIAARRALTGEALDVALGTIEAERLARLMEAQVQVVRGFRDQVKGVFTDLFDSIFNQGVERFADLFDGIKRMFFRMLAEMTAKAAMQKIGEPLVKSLVAAFSDVAALASGGTAVRGHMINVSAYAPRTGRTVDTPAGPSVIEAPLAGVIPTGAMARRNQEAMKKFAGYLSAALVGASLGQMFGYSSGSALVGALGGGLSGAATGFMMAGPVGGIIGGIAGLGAGILGAHKRHQEEQKRLRETLSRNSETITRLRETIDGSPLMSGKNLAAAMGMSGGLAGIAKFGGFMGPLLAGKFGGVSTKELGEALKGFDSSKRLQAIEQQFGITMQQVGRMAREMGIELFDSAGKLIPDALKQLDEALRLTIQAATTFTKSLDDIRLRQEAYNRLFDVPDTPARQLNDAYARLAEMAPDLLKQMGLANLDLGSETGRRVLLSGLQEIYKLITSGQLTPELLGAFTDKGQLIQAILDAKDGLDAFRKTLGDVTTDFPRAMDLILYEQRYGKGPRDTGAGAPAAPRAPAGPTDVGAGGGSVGGTVITGNTFHVTLQSRGGESDEELVERFQRAVTGVAARGGKVVLPSTITTSRL